MMYEMRALTVDEISAVAGAGGYSSSTTPTVSISKSKVINNTQTNVANVTAGTYSDVSQTNAALNQIDSKVVIVTKFGY